MSEHSISVPATQQILEIMAQAMLVNTQGKYNVFVGFSGHVNTFDVQVFKGTYDWVTGSEEAHIRAKVLHHYVRLDATAAHNRLQDIAAELSQLRDTSDIAGGDHA